MVSYYLPQDVHCFHNGRHFSVLCRNVCRSYLLNLLLLLLIHHNFSRNVLRPKCVFLNYFFALNFNVLASSISSYSNGYRCRASLCKRLYLVLSMSFLLVVFEYWTLVLICVSSWKLSKFRKVCRSHSCAAYRFSVSLFLKTFHLNSN